MQHLITMMVTKKIQIQLLHLFNHIVKKLDKPRLFNLVQMLEADQELIRFQSREAKIEIQQIFTITVDLN